MGIILDTGFLYALKDEDDPHHVDATSLLESLDWDSHYPVVTTNLIVNETYSLMVFRSNGNVSLLPALDELFWGEENFFRIMEINVGDFQKVAQILRKYVTRKRLLSFVDASLIFLGELYNFKEIISYDSHFEGLFLNFAGRE